MPPGQTTKGGYHRIGHFAKQVAWIREPAGAAVWPRLTAIPTWSPPGQPAASVYVYQHGAGLPSAQRPSSVSTPPAVSITVQSSPSDWRRDGEHDRWRPTIGARIFWYAA